MHAYASDHNPIILNTATSNNHLPRLFRFKEFWTKDPSCGVTVSTTWNSFFEGSHTFSLTKNLKATKYALKTWNNLHFGNIQKQIESLTCLLDAIQQSRHSAQSHHVELSLKKDLDELLLQEAILWKNNSRETWLTCKDLNIKFFILKC